MDKPSVSGLHLFNRRRILSSFGDLPSWSHENEEEKTVPTWLPEDQWNFVRERNNPNAIVYGNQCQFHPGYALGTAAVRGNKKLTKNSVVYWEIRPQALFGTSIMFGIGTESVSTSHQQHYADILGADNDSYGLSHYGIAQHGGLAVRITEDPMPASDIRVGLLFDGPNASLSYFLNGQFLATPFTNIDTSKVWYPMLSSTAQRSAFAVVNQRCLYTVPTLFNYALQATRSHLRGELPTDLPVPRSLRLKLLPTEQRKRIRRDKEADSGRVEGGVVLPANCADIVRELYKRSSFSQ